MWDAGGSSTSSPPPSTSGQISSRPARPQAVQHRVLAHVFGVDVAPHPQGVAVVEPGLAAALGAPHQEIAALVAHQGIGDDLAVGGVFLGPGSFYEGAPCSGSTRARPRKSGFREWARRPLSSKPVRFA